MVPVPALVLVSAPVPVPVTVPPPQNSSQFMKHTRRRKLTVEDFNRALRWSNVEVRWLGLDLGGGGGEVPCCIPVGTRTGGGGTRLPLPPVTGDTGGAAS